MGFSALTNVFAPLRQFDGQMLKGKVIRAETKAKRLLIPVERTREDNAKQGHGHATCTVSRSETHLGVDSQVKQLVMDNTEAFFMWFSWRDSFEHDLDLRSYSVTAEDNRVFFQMSDSTCSSQMTHGRSGQSRKLDIV